MFGIVISEKTYKYISNDKLFYLLLIQCEAQIKEYESNWHIVIFKLSRNTAGTIFELAEMIYKQFPNENNKWCFGDEKFQLEDIKAIKRFLVICEVGNIHPLEKRLLSDIIDDNDITCLNQITSLTKAPFSGVYKLDRNDIHHIYGASTEQKRESSLQFNRSNINISHRYITNDIDIQKGNVCFNHCIFERNITISGADSVSFFQCIVRGCIVCVDVPCIRFSSSNIKELLLYNANIDSLHIHYCRIFRFAFHSCNVNNMDMWRNRFTEPYLANLTFKNTNQEIDMSQFERKNISERIIKRITNKSSIKIKDEDSFFLTFIYLEPAQAVKPNDITIDMIDIILDHGSLDKNHQLYGDMKYKRALYSNTGWRRFFVRITGAFYIPSRWIIYISICTVIFALLYSFVPGIYFSHINANTTHNLNLWTAFYYSLFQLIGTNPTAYQPGIVAQICTTIQALLNTVFIANLFAALIKKYMRDDA